MPPTCQPGILHTDTGSHPTATTTCTRSPLRSVAAKRMVRILWQLTILYWFYLTIFPITSQLSLPTQYWGNLSGQTISCPSATAFLMPT
jgi:hypothetical protein